jgi:outer membrane protein OmpA-like peptidoglycan-associated protein
MVLITCFLLLTTALMAQNSAVPTVIYVENTYTSQAEEGVELQVAIKQPNGQQYKLSTHHTNADGMVNLSLQPDISYSITSRKSDYYTQLTLLKTTDLARTSKNRFNISLRPKSCYRLKGQIRGEQVVWKNAYFTMTNIATQEIQRVELSVRGEYHTCGKCGETYIIAPFVDDKAQVLDTLYLDPTQCQTGRNPLLQFDFQLNPQPPAIEESLPKEENEIAKTKTVEAIEQLAIGDSLIIDELRFEGKTKKLDSNGKQALEDLLKALKANPDLFIELIVHTDARKSERYNWLVAQRRGVWLAEFFANQGVPAERILITPVGEARILNHCTNNKRCTTAEHAVNDRVEMVRHPNGAPKEN